MLCRTKRRDALFPQRDRGALGHPEMWPHTMPSGPVLSAHREHFFFLRFFFLMSAIFKVFFEFVTGFLLFSGLAFQFQSTWDLSSLSRDQTCASRTGRWKLNRWATREVPTRWGLLEQLLCLFAASLAARDRCDTSIVQQWLSKSFLTRDGDGSDPTNCRHHTALPYPKLNIPGIFMKLPHGSGCPPAYRSSTWAHVLSWGSPEHPGPPQEWAGVPTKSCFTLTPAAGGWLGAQRGVVFSPSLHSYQ